ncbi:hypothetical protein EVAR_26810_1 [Eumeta japonica]|uniref:Uncharacterized protein n=1 Tax=Eumeta variegata TaxID=151549 RepID=A0A4C1WF30_EUMVA|nr:hypothetical protein EVAR_26810_1 [Eumeta japonica]
MDTCKFRGVTSALLVSWVGIGYLMEWESLEGEWATGFLTHWPKQNNESCIHVVLFVRRRRDSTVPRAGSTIWLFGLQPRTPWIQGAPG